MGFLLIFCHLMYKSFSRAATHDEPVGNGQDGEDEEHGDERAIEDDIAHRCPQRRTAENHWDDTHRGGG